MRMFRLGSISTLLAACYVSTKVQPVVGQDLDRFNYDVTVDRGDGFSDYGPPEWGLISCDERSNLDGCVGYPDKWHTGREWEIERNYCRWCPEGLENCGRHHQSPIDLLRNRGIEDHPLGNECIDIHWMKYEDSTCRWEQMVEANAFVVDRHALRVIQPITMLEDDEYILDCREIGIGRRLGRIDFSKGFSDWWHLSHIDFHVPSEHTQQGERYSAEVQMYHFYSVSGEAAMVDNEMGTVSVFLQVYDDAAPYRDLDRIICQWRRYEEMTRQQCGLDPVAENYPGCFPNIRQSTVGKRNMRAGSTTPMAKNQPTSRKKFQTIHDIIVHNSLHKANTNVTKPRFKLDDINWAPAEEKDWDTWIAEQSSKLQQHDKTYKTHQRKKGANQTSANLLEEEEEEGRDDRHLIQGDELIWFNYFPMVGARTEYYYRYSGSQSIPPCYGNFQENTRSETNHWRVLKDPIRIHERQLNEMKRLLKERIAPADDPVNPCSPDTAARVDDATDTVDTARPLQYFHPAHFKTFCECKDWRSKWPEDREWCEIDDIYERFYAKPYNFISDDKFDF